jgi:hypothetical protein
VSFDEKLVEFKTAPSAQLESVWWLPSRHSDVSLILSNTSEQTVSANAVINAGTAVPQPVDLTLAPHETRVIKVNPQKGDAAARFKDDVGSASVHHTDANGALIARALIEDQHSGYSFSAEVLLPAGWEVFSLSGRRQNRLVSAGSHVSGVGTDADVTAMNSGTATVTAQWEVYSYTSIYNLNWALMSVKRVASRLHRIPRFKLQLHQTI